MATLIFLKKWFFLSKLSTSGRIFLHQTSLASNPPSRSRSFSERNIYFLNGWIFVSCLLLVAGVSLAILKYLSGISLGLDFISCVVCLPTLVVTLGYERQIIFRVGREIKLVEVGIVEWWLFHHPYDITRAKITRPIFVYSLPFLTWSRAFAFSHLWY